MAAYQASSRPADVFSLGCVLLEMHTIAITNSLEVLRRLRKRHDRSFQANRTATIDWLGSKEWKNLLTHKAQVHDEVTAQIGEMLGEYPVERPKIGQVKKAFASLGLHPQIQSGHQFFMECCSVDRNTLEERDRTAFICPNCKEVLKSSSDYEYVSIAISCIIFADSAVNICASTTSHIYAMFKAVIEGCQETGTLGPTTSSGTRKVHIVVGLSETHTNAPPNIAAIKARSGHVSITLGRISVACTEMKMRQI